MLCVCQTLIKALLTYLLISNPGIPGLEISQSRDPGIEKTVPGLQTLPGSSNLLLLRDCLLELVQLFAPDERLMPVA